jgi:hypothetical protein
MCVLRRVAEGAIDLLALVVVVLSVGSIVAAIAVAVNLFN